MKSIISNKDPFKITLSEPVINGNVWKYVKDCLDTGWVSSSGAYIPKFEKMVADYLGTKYAVATINGTSALHVSLIACGLQSNEEVIVPSVTFIAPVNAVSYVGAKPVFMDCDDYLNIDLDKTLDFFRKECEVRKAKLFNKKTKRRIRAIILVHIFGHPVNIEPLSDLVSKYDLRIIEDATESFGSYYVNGGYRGKKAGVIGDAGCLSFNGNKIITTGGGGMIVTNDKKAAQRARYLTTQARDNEVKYIHKEIGYNYRLSNVAAAIGIAQLENLDNYIKIKRENFFIYNTGMKDIKGLRMIAEPAYSHSNYWFYSLVVDKEIYGKNNLDLMNILGHNSIQSRPLWYLNHRQKPYKNCQNYKIEKAQNYFKQVLNLPCSVNLRKEDIRRIIGIIRKNAKR